MPPRLAAPFLGLKYTSDYHTPSIDQRALAAFIQEGHLQRHLARVRRQYRANRAVLMVEVARAFGERARLHGDATGLHLWLEVPSPLSGEALAAAAARQGVGVYPLASFYHPSESAPAGCHLVLGYGTLSPAEIPAGNPETGPFGRKVNCIYRNVHLVGITHPPWKQGVRGTIRPITGGVFR